MDEIILIFVNLTSSIYFLKKQLIFYINTLNYFKYLHISFKRNSYFYKKKRGYYYQNVIKKKDII